MGCACFWRAERQARRNHTAQHRPQISKHFAAARSCKSFAPVSKLAFCHMLPEGSAAPNQGDPLGV